jgi:hypothetical protein
MSPTVKGQSRRDFLSNVSCGTAACALAFCLPGGDVSEAAGIVHGAEGQERTYPIPSADGVFQCSKHDSRYAADGTHTAGRATRNMDRFPIHRAGESVIVDVSRIIRSDQDPAGWTNAVVSLK